MKLGGRSLLAVAAAIAVSTAAATLDGEPSEPAPAADPAASAEIETVTVVEARGRARMLQSVYEATLRAIHRRYFDADEKDVIPARALKDVFEEADAGTGRATRWIAVNTPPMNVDHAPKPGFEAEAVAALSDGAEEFEAVEGRTYRRAGAVALSASCLKCHESGLTKRITKQRVAAIVIEIPVRPE